MKKNAVPVLVIAMLLAWVVPGFCLAESAPSDEKVKAAAIVNGNSITETQVEEALMKGLQAATRGMPQSPEKVDEFRKMYRDRVLENLIRNELLLEEAKKQKITVGQEELVAALSEQIEMQLTGSGGNRQEYEEMALKPKGMTWDQFIADIANRPEVAHAYMFEKLVKTKSPEQVKV
ncbi:MAG: SurA N-terminal domain-containing protein, partial [Desulfatibacillum sp.]|nr:SurA N-terminal domain-containing protein [Desulfatibacillum sp.]